MVDPSYIRGWDDCLETIEVVLAKAANLADVKTKVTSLRNLVKQNKFERIKYELGAFDIF